MIELPRVEMPVLMTVRKDVLDKVRAQSAKVDIISGATLTSKAFIRSLDNALRQATA